MEAVSVQQVWQYYGDYPALRDISFAVAPGACLALLGRNGAGKTTLLRMMAGLSRPAKGRVLVQGMDNRAEAVRQQTGILGHGIGIYEELTARENLELFGRLYNLPDVAQTADEWLLRTDLKRVGDSPVREFSRGMRQRLAIARAFLHGPKVLFLDEPFTALDDRAIALLQKLLREQLALGATVVMSTHQLKEALELATDVALLNSGRLAHAGARTAEMLADPAYLYRTYGE